jgi:predicted metal-dependent HD superfamily phosphohydrolase
MIDLHEAWRSTWRALGVADPDMALCDTLLACYAAPQRHYHSVQHLQECFVHWEALRDVAQHPAEVALALWFHDAVYDVHRHDNEARSAAWAQDAAAAAGCGTQAAERIAALVLATRHDAEPGSPDAQVLIDVDLAILAAAPERFAEYESQVRAEYAHVPDWLFKRARRKVLEGFLRRPRIYWTERFWRQYEETARGNLRRALA